MSFLGIELGSTRIKAVLINDEFKPIASGDHTWQSSLDNGIWTYDLNDAWDGLRDALNRLKADFKYQNRNLPIEIKSMGISAMMHGYLAFDKDWNLLVPFRTWQNTITAEAAAKLSEAFKFNIPQRWSIAHLYQAILNGEEHVKKIAHITTLAGYIHFRLTGVNAVGVGEASGMFPIDSETGSYNPQMLEIFNNLVNDYGYSWQLKNVLPSVLSAGENAGTLSTEGSLLLNGVLPSGIPFAPCEGDAGTGMAATNSVAVRTGNISAGTSIFSMVVLEKPLTNYYEEIDMVTTPDGVPVAMVHCNNCTPDSNAWISLISQGCGIFGQAPESGDLYTKLYLESLKGDNDCGGVIICNYLAGEGVTHLDSGFPLVTRLPEAKFTMANFVRAMLYSSMSTLKLGMMKLEDENVAIDSMTGHGGLFKTAGVAQKYMAAACKAPVNCMETAGEGGPYGMALLAAYAYFKKKVNEDLALKNFLNEYVFSGLSVKTELPDPEIVSGFETYINNYKKLIEVEKKAVEVLNA